MKKNVIITRAVSGSGKSTFASLLSKHIGVVTVCADDFFTRADGSYHFDATLLGRAHKNCQFMFDQALKEPTVETIIVANTNTTESDFKYYEEQAKKFGATVFHVVLENRHGSSDVHGVPDAAKEKQRGRLANSLKL